jgi:hypothetical protein
VRVMAMAGPVRFGPVRFGPVAMAVRVAHCGFTR